MTYEELEEEIGDISRVLIEPIKDNLFKISGRGYIADQTFYTPVIETGFKGRFFYQAYNKFYDKTPKRFIISFIMYIYDPASKYVISRQFFDEVVTYDQMAGVLSPTLISPNPLYLLHLHLRAHRINYKEFLDSFRFALELLFLEHI